MINRGEEISRMKLELRLKVRSYQLLAFIYWV